MEFTDKLQKKLMNVWNAPMEDTERAVLHLIWGNWHEGKKITQRQIADSENWLGHHEKHEADVVGRKKESTLRKVRQIIRDLRIKYRIPILSDRNGYWIPANESEVREYIERMEKVAKAQAAAWHQTYGAVKETLNVTSSFFDQMSYDETETMQ